MKNLFFAGLLLMAVTVQVNAYSNLQAKKYGAKAGTVFHEYDTATLNGKWELMPVLSSDTAAGKIPFLVFNLKANTFTGNTGCNDISGGFFLQQNALQFNENLISTKKACPGYNENAFIDNLLKTNRYEIKDGVLQLMYNATVLSKWARHVDKNQGKEI
ncbi:META domain-containing protein [Parafilimonas sp.]|uniref:META domain-containing protein n=1 Tax=Parafilimonas sp. TaxID=1969739 RepID=UPI0039E6B9C9